jgi:acyl dehydratase
VSSVFSFEDVPLDQPFEGQARTLTETDLTMFSMLMGDWSPIHADEEYARATKLGRRMFHGTFGIGLAVSMSASLLHFTTPVIAALGVREWTFKAPLFIGDTVRLRLTVTEKRIASSGNRAIVARRLQLVKHDGSVAQEGYADLMIALGDAPKG